MPSSDFDVVTGPSMPQRRTPAPQRSNGPAAEKSAPTPLGSARAGDRSGSERHQ